ncbi:MAG: RNA-binding protein [Thaumarchaeota archaeon]|nr:RNA-binding protein [Nitrososphaerota archaeon]
MKSNFISKSETSKISRKVCEQWKISFPKCKNLKLFQIDNHTIFTNGNLHIIKINDLFIPSLLSITILEQLPSVFVDINAVKFICNGANVMKPGITNHTRFMENEIVCVKEESYNKFVAIGISVVSSDIMQTKSKGIIIKNLHYIGDCVWNFLKNY